MLSKNRLVLDCTQLKGFSGFWASRACRVICCLSRVQDGDNKEKPKPKADLEALGF